jgi:hypothetical protein
MPHVSLHYVYICATNCVDDSCNRALSYTQYDAGVHFLLLLITNNYSSVLRRSICGDRGPLGCPTQGAAL